MSRTIPIALQTHLDTTSRTMAEILIVTQVAPGSSAVLYLTTHNRSITIGSGDEFMGTYLPLGYPRKDLTAHDDLSVGNTEVDGIQTSAYLLEDDIRAGRWAGATWRKGWVNYKSPGDGVIELGRGTIGNISWGRARFVAELVDLLQRLQNGIGRLNSPLCIHKFGASENGPGLGNGCTVNVSSGSPSFTQTGTVDSMDSDFYGIHDAERTEPDSYYSNGIFRVTSGVMIGMEFEIRAYIYDVGAAEGFWILFTAVPYDVTGETYEIVRGCNKSRRQCKDDFNNINDRLASDFTQGNDNAVQQGRQ